jgi:tRNA (guanine-N7-)-methyltransferase
MHTDPGIRAAAACEDGPAAQRYPRNFSVRSRHSALSAAQQRTWQRLWPRLGTEVHPPGRPGAAEPLNGWFERDARVVLEIGSGAGASTVAMAQAEPDIDVVAVEVYRRGLAQLLCAIERAGLEKLTNIRLIRGDALDVLEQLTAPASLTGVRVFFPDPWPKSRHHKRRLLQPATISLIAERLRPGGVLHAATDHLGYAEQIAEAGDAEHRLRRVAPGIALPISVARPVTKYEAKARDAGRAVTELLWERL